MFRTLPRGILQVRASCNTATRVRTTMTAAASRVQLAADVQPEYYLPNNTSKESATTASHLLQEVSVQHVRLGCKVC